METAKVFESGRSQAIRIPQKYRFNVDELVVSKLGDAVLLVPKDKVWETFLEGVKGFSDDVFSEGRVDLPPEEREQL